MSTYAGGAVSWSSCLQKSVAISTTEAEIVAASEGAKEALWLKRLLVELNKIVDSPPKLHVDSASAVKLSKNPEYHKRTKHIEIRHFFVRGKQLNGEISVQHIDGKSNVSDIMTKVLDRGRFETLRGMLGMM